MKIQMKQLCQIYGTDVEPNPQDGRVYDSNGIIPALMSGGGKIPKTIVEVKNEHK